LPVGQITGFPGWTPPPSALNSPMAIFYRILPEKTCAISFLFWGRGAELRGRTFL
jgi:hypothetical protein